MPRKAKLTKKEEEQKIKEKKALTQEESNSLEQMIKGEDKKIDSSEIEEVFNPKEQNIKIISSTSLKKINPPQRNPIMLERDIITGNMSINNTNKNDEENGFKYIPNTSEKEEPKYIQYSGKMVERIISPNEIIKPRIKMDSLQRREARFESSMKEESQMQEDMHKYSPSIITTDTLRNERKEKRTSLNTKEVKYTPGGY